MTLGAKVVVYTLPDPAQNPALALAQELKNRLVITYSSTERFDAINTRWRGQIAENAKSLAFGHVLPEMNHNQLVGWKVLTEPMAEMHVLFLRDKQDHPRVQIRMDITKEIIARQTEHCTDVLERRKEPACPYVLTAVPGRLGELLHGDPPRGRPDARGRDQSSQNRAGEGEMRKQHIIALGRGRVYRRPHRGGNGLPQRNLVGRKDLIIHYPWITG